VFGTGSSRASKPALIFRGFCLQRQAPDRGYMESFMDWHLIYRNHDEMRSLVDALPAGSVADYKIFDDEDDTIVFLQITKAC
jgi:hypothetical protein